MTEKNLIILRGLPNSGKSTFASLISEDICCADDFFMDKGEYKFDKTKLGEAHEWCQLKCRLKMACGYSKIVVANTNTTEKEMAPYIKLAEAFRYKVFYVIVENRHEGDNHHNVPAETIELMKNRFEIKL
jgi:predicted kinase